MGKWKLYIVMMLMMVLTATALSDCKAIITPKDVPCFVISSWQFPNACNTYEIKIYNQTPALINTLSMADYGTSGRCNITFNYTTVGSYLMNWSSGDSSKIVVEGSSEMELALIIGIGIILLICLVLAIYFKQIWIKMLFFFSMMGMLLLEIRITKIMAETNNMSNNIIKLIGSSYAVVMWITLFLIFAAFIVALVGVFVYLKDTKDFKNKRGVPDIKFE